MKAPLITGKKETVSHPVTNTPERVAEELGKRAWKRWEDSRDEPAIKFFHCGYEVWQNAFQGKKSERKFEDVPDCFRNRTLTDIYFETMAKCATINIEAATRLHCIATLAVQYLNEAAFAAPQNFQKIAETSIEWPGFLSDHPEAEKTQKGYLFPKLHLGEKSGIKLKGKPFSLHTPATRIAFELWGKLMFYRHDKSPAPPGKTTLDRIKADAKKLPTLSSQNLDRWWKVAERMFQLIYGEDFEKHDQFAHWMGRAGEMAVKEQKKERGLVRREIKKSIRQSFKSLAQKVESTEPRFRPPR